MTQPDIDAQVAAFRDQLETIAVVTPGELENATRELFRAIATAPTDSAAGKALLTFMGGNATHCTFRDIVAREALSHYALFIASEAPPFQMRTMMDRFRHVALAWRICQPAKKGEL